MKMRNEDIITVNTAEEYAALFGCSPICHPLLSVCRLSAVKDYNPYWQASEIKSLYHYDKGQDHLQCQLRMAQL